MKIGTRLTFQFMAIVGLIMGVVLLVIYNLSALNTRNEFFARLKERAVITAHFFLEQDEINKTNFQAFEKKYLQSLPDEIIQIFDLNDSTIFIEKNQNLMFSGLTLDKIRAENEVYFSEKNRQIVGIYYRDNQGDFVIMASAIDRYGNSKLDYLGLVILVSFFCGLWVIYFSGRVYSRRALSPVPLMVRKVKQISASNLHLRVDEGKSKDEIAELASTFNDMLLRLETSFAVQQTFVRNASHELRTPLTAIIGEIEVMLSRDREKHEFRQAMGSILLNAQNLKQLVNNLLNLAQVNQENVTTGWEEIRLDELLWEIKVETENYFENSEIGLDFSALPEDPDSLKITGNRQLLMSALGNVLDNALKFSENRPVKCRIEPRNNSVLIEVADRGIGISRNDLENIFQPFFRGESARGFKGHGIGLALTERIIRIHHGQISIKSEVGKGTVVSIEFFRQGASQGDGL